jgi:phage host-nuclease inhibitor protein Gam
MTDKKIGDWHDAEQALARLGQLHRDVKALEVARDEAIQQAKHAFNLKAAPLDGEIERLAAALQGFALEHQDELEGRSRKLDHGRLGFLLVREVVIRSLKKAIAWLLEARKVQYLRVKHELNKETLREAAPEILKACGARIRTRDEFWYEVDGERHAVKD